MSVGINIVEAKARKASWIIILSPKYQTKDSGITEGSLIGQVGVGGQNRRNYVIGAVFPGK